MREPTAVRDSRLPVSSKVLLAGATPSRQPSSRQTSSERLRARRSNHDPHDRSAVLRDVAGPTRSGLHRIPSPMAAPGAAPVMRSLAAAYGEKHRVPARRSPWSSSTLPGRIPGSRAGPLPRPSVRYTLRLCARASRSSSTVGAGIGSLTSARLDRLRCGGRVHAGESTTNGSHERRLASWESLT